MGVLKSASFLDPRNANAARECPIKDSVNIPVEKFAERINELPPPHRVIHVANVDNLFEPARERLYELGRIGVIASDWLFEPSSDLRLWSPSPFLTSVLPSLHGGSALDLGCGTGRDAVQLASEGYRVTAIDRLPDAIDRGKRLAATYLDAETASSIVWRQFNLSNSSLPNEDFDLITSFFFLHKAILSNIQANLRTGGSLLLEGFTRIHKEKFGQPRSVHHYLCPEELSELLGRLEIQQIDEGFRDDGRHTVRAWAIRR